MNQEAKIIWRNFFWLPILKDISGEGLQQKASVPPNQGKMLVGLGKKLNDLNRTFLNRIRR